MGKYGKKAIEYHNKKYNCAQSVVLAFKDEIGIDESILANLVANFGGGFGYSGEICGAASGMAVVSGYLGEWKEPNDIISKKISYNRINNLIKQFSNENKEKCRCDDLRQLRKNSGRSCLELIEQCADMVAKELGLS